MIKPFKDMSINELIRFISEYQILIKKAEIEIETRLFSKIKQKRSNK